MVWYVAIVAILNLALGYALALYMGRPQIAAAGADATDDSEYEEYAGN